MLKQIEETKKLFKEALSQISSNNDLEAIRHKYLSRKGQVAELFSGLKITALLM